MPCTSGRCCSHDSTKRIDLADLHCPKTTWSLRSIGRASTWSTIKSKSYSNFHSPKLRPFQLQSLSLTLNFFVLFKLFFCSNVKCINKELVKVIRRISHFRRSKATITPSRPAIRTTFENWSFRFSKVSNESHAMWLRYKTTTHRVSPKKNQINKSSLKITFVYWKYSLFFLFY